MNAKRGGNVGSGLIGGILFGLVFGFLLQKGGVAKYNVLVGQLLLEDFTVLKVMMSAVAVGTIGVYAMLKAGLVRLHLKPTLIGAQSIGGVIFGAGFALAAYCPGTGAAAIGQGSWDALLVAAGLIVGSYLYALASGVLEKTVKKWGDKGKLTVPGVTEMSGMTSAVIAAGLIAVALGVIEIFLP